ncbi:MAG: ribbon-helix-helix domain-containing protein [Candidatus Brocadiia bacterium]
MPSEQREVISFKVDRSMLEAMKGIQNRSEFIRKAILMALDNRCPLCGGTGALTPQQKEHWEQFAENHSLEECDQCHEVRLICSNG